MKNEMSKYRYLELKYFALQYSEFKERLKILEGKNFPERIFPKTKLNGYSDYVPKLVSEIIDVKKKIEIIEKAALTCDEQIGRFILQAVTKNLSFTQMKMRENLPCERDMFYDRRRRFFKALDIYK